MNAPGGKPVQFFPAIYRNAQWCSSVTNVNAPPAARLRADERCGAGFL
jgi:hypothetical protein